MRNTREGCIWQAYSIENDIEKEILTKNASQNGFIVETEDEGYTEETSPGWRETDEWKKCLQKYLKLS